jgi:transposase
MANQLSMANLRSIEILLKSGTSCREIARLLGLDRETVRKYAARLQNQPNAPPGSVNGESTDSKPESIAPPDAPPGPPSACEPFREQIVAKLERGLSARRIYQDLVTEHGFSAKYHSVRRFVARLTRQSDLPVRRLEVEPGAEAQIDFGTGAPVKMEKGTLRRPWVFRIVLSGSRKGYSEAVWRQSTEAFIGALENAFRHFGGVPGTLVIDNLKAAVQRGDWYDPEVHPKLQSFAAHYGTVFLPTKPYTPRHKGKIESGVKYVKNNGLKGRVFESLAAENAFLLDWEQTVADTRIHGTTKRHVREVFEEIERKALLPLPAERFPFFHEAHRAVHRDGYVEVDKAYYSVPPEYVGRRLWVRWDSRLVRVFNDRWEQLVVHAKTEPGRFRTDPQHIPREKVSAVERGTDALLRQVAAIGPHATEWSAAMVQARGVEGVRVLVGLKALAGKHRSAAIDEACRTALTHGAFRLRTIRELLQRQADAQQLQQQQFEFLTEHPVIRPLSDYSLASLLQFRKDRFDERDIG